MGLLLTQQVNLYQSEFRPQAMVLCAKNVQYSVIVLLVLLGLITVWDYWQGHQQAQRMTELSQQHQLLLKSVQHAKLSAPAEFGDAQLLLRVTQLEQEFQHKRQVLDALSGQTFGNTRGFSGYFAGLARQSVAGLWITALDIRQGGKILGLRGSAFRPELVPLLLQRLSQELEFNGTEFNTFSVQRQHNPLRVDFILHTDAMSEQAK